MIKARKDNSIKMLIFICCITLILSGCHSTSSDMGSEVDKLAHTVLEETPEATVGSVNGEWAVMGLAKSGIDVPDDYFEIYYDNVRAYVKSKNGILSQDKSTEYSRLILALTEIDRNPSDVEGYDLTDPLNDFEMVAEQGINGPVFALIASHKANVRLKTEEQYISFILDNEKKSGGFGFTETIDPGMTAMVIQALAPYMERPDVKELIERSFSTISKAQNDDGTFDGGSETVAQLILALCAAERDPLTDEQFAKTGSGICDILLSYATDGGLSHEKGEKANTMATEQGLYALASALEK